MRRAKGLGMLAESVHLGSHVVITGFLKRESSKGEDTHLKWFKLAINMSLFLSSCSQRIGPLV